MKLLRYRAALNSGLCITEKTEEGTSLSWESLHWSNTSNRVKKNHVTLDEEERGLLLHAKIAMELQAFTETMSFTEIDPVSIEMQADTDSPIVAYYYFKDWWTRPAFISSFEEVPDQTAILFYKEKSVYHFLLALPGKVFRAHFAGEKGNPSIRLILSADSGGYTELEETAMLAVWDENPYLCMEKGMKFAAELYHIPLREQRVFPELFEKIGWCSWDAFYKDVTEAGLTAKAEEIRDKKIPFGWMIIDDGWQDYRNDRMVSYGTNKEKFPEGLSGATEKIRRICGINEIGVWHAFSGYWCGIDPEGPLAKEHPELFMSTHQGKLVPKPDPEAAFQFYGNWYRYLKTQGINFVKVDSQSSTRQHYRTNTPIGKTSAALHAGLDQATEAYLNGGLINCMGMAMEDVLQRPVSGVSRNSDDFFPLAEESFKEHLLENAYNTIWHNVIYYGDWDMFWSNHPYARKHALLRSLSAGPVYVSDRVGETKPEVLMPLCYQDGTLLRAEKGALPTQDCVLQDPAAAGYLKLQNTCGNVGYLALYSYKNSPQEVKVRLSDLSLLVNQQNRQVQTDDTQQSRKYAICDTFAETGLTGTEETEWICRLESESCTLYQAAPIMNGIAVFGRADKYLSSHAIQAEEIIADGLSLEIKEMGPVRIYAERKPICLVDGEETEAVPLNSEGFYRIEMPVIEKKAQIHIIIR